MGRGSFRLCFPAFSQPVGFSRWQAALSCAHSLGGGKGLVLLQELPAPCVCSLRRALVAVALSGVMGCARAPGGPRLFLELLLQLAVGRAEVLCSRSRERPEVRLGGSRICHKCCKQNQEVSEDPSGDVGLAFGAPELAASGRFSAAALLGSLQLAETRPQKELHH